MKGYTNKEAIENYMLIDIDDQFDDQVDEWIQGAEEYIDNVTNRDFALVEEEAVAEDRTFDGDGTNTIDIDGCTEIEEIRFSEDGDPIDEDQYVLLPVRSDTITKIKLKYIRFPKGTQNIYVKAKWGYASIPKSIKFAATVIVAGIINNAWQSESEIQSMTIGRYSVSYKNKKEVNDIEQVQESLGMYKKYQF